MTDSDPFADYNPKKKAPQRTVIVPAPGGRKKKPQTSAAIKPPALSRPVETPVVETHTQNPLIRSAGTLFALARKLKNTISHKDVARLRLNTLKMLNRFNQDAIKSGCGKDAVHFSCYALCALIDEIVLETPWGNQSNWDHESLLGTLFNDARGGEKFFQILERSAWNPADNIDLLEFLYICLGLGFQGKYAITQGGGEQLEILTRNLYQTIRTHRGGPDRFLSSNWQSGETPRRDRFLPIWVVPVATVGLAALMFYFFNAAINRTSLDAEAKLNQIGRTTAVAMPAPVPPSAVQALLPLPAAKEPTWLQTLQERLQEERERGWIDIEKAGLGVKITLYNLGLFKSGSAHVSDLFHPILSKIGGVLNEIPGYIHVTGHTDNRPIRTLQFPSNWRLSMARAEAVSHILSTATGSRDKFKPKGKAEFEPIASNDTPEGRRKNRRVEIFIPRIH